jgi:hypothetical protein
MFHSLFVLIRLKGGSVSFYIPCLSRISDIPTRSIGSGINFRCPPNQGVLYAYEYDPFHDMQAPSFLSFKADGNVMNETVACGVTVSFCRYPLLLLTPLPRERPRT